MEKKAKFSIPPTAKHKPGLPLPPAKAVHLKKVSPAERAELEKYGWKDGDPVPTNLADVIAEAQREATDLDYLPPPVDIRTPPVQIPEEVALEKLPPSQQEKYQIVLESLNEAKFIAQQQLEMKESMRLEADPTVKEAIAASLGQGEQLELPEEEPTASSTPAELCTHCGWPQDIKDPVIVEEHDKAIFLQSLLGSLPFFKTFTVYGGHLKVTLRSLSVEEFDLIFRQLENDKALGRNKNNIEQAEALTRYRLSLQVVELQGKVGKAESPTLPDSLDGWKKLVKEPDNGDTILRPILEKFMKDTDNSESMHRLLSGLLLRFNSLLNKLEVNADNSDFYSAIS